jgi:hypothetical protein
MDNSEVKIARELMLRGKYSNEVASFACGQRNSDDHEGTTRLWMQIQTKFDKCLFWEKVHFYTSRGDVPD